MRAERLLMLVRDVGCIALGLGGIAHQVWTWQSGGKVSEALLVACTTLLGIPTAVGLRSLRNGGTGTTEPSSPSAAPSPSPRPSSPSSTVSAGDDP